MFFFGPVLIIYSRYGRAKHVYHTYCQLYARALILFFPMFIRYFHTRNMYRLIPLRYEILYYGCLGVIYSTHTHFSKNIRFAYPTKLRTDLMVSLR